MFNRNGDWVSGIGLGPMAIQLRDDAIARTLAIGGSPCWLNNDRILAATPSIVSFDRPFTSSQPFFDFSPNELYAGNDRWMASRLVTGQPIQSVGTISPSEVNRAAHDAGRDGTIINVLNGEFHAEIIGQEPIKLDCSYAKAGDFGRIAMIRKGLLVIRNADGSETIPDQWDGVEWPVPVSNNLVLYSTPTMGLVLHSVLNRNKGRQWLDYQPMGDWYWHQSFYPDGIDLGDGTAFVGYGIRSGMQPADIRRHRFALSDLQEIKRPPIPTPRTMRRLHRGMTEAYPTDPGNCVQGGDLTDSRPNLVGVFDPYRKCLGVIWEPKNAGERQKAIDLARKENTSILVYDDKGDYRQETMDAMYALRNEGMSAIPFVQAYLLGQSASDAARRIKRSLDKLWDERNIFLWRGLYDASNQWVMDEVENLQTEIDIIIHDYPNIKGDIAFARRRDSNSQEPRLLDYWKRLVDITPGPAEPLPGPTPIDPEPPDTGVEMPKPKNVDQFRKRCTDEMMKLYPLANRTEVEQSVREWCDKPTLFGVAWSADGAMMNHFTRAGQASHIITHAERDAISTAAATIEKEELQ